MSLTAGKIVISLSAGTAQYITDVDAATKANKRLGDSADQLRGKIGQIGAHGVTNVQAVSASLRTLEGGLTNNLRAAERFIATFSTLRNFAQLAFPVAGFAAVTGVFVELAEHANRAYQAIKKMQELPQSINLAFNGLVNPIKAQNAELQVSNDLLEREIDKLQKKPTTNGIKLTLDEAYLSAVRLGGELQKDLADVSKIVNENKTGFLGWAFGKADNSGVGDQAQKFGQSLDTVQREGELKIHAAGGNTQVALDAVKQLNATTRSMLDQEIRSVQQQLAAAQAKQNDRYIRSPLTGNISGENPAWRDQSALIASLQKFLDVLLARANSITLNDQHGGLEDKLNVLRDKERPAAKEDPFANALREEQSQLEEVRAKLQGLQAQNPIVAAMAEAFSSANKKIQDVNASLARMREKPLSFPQVMQIDSVAAQVGAVNALAKAQEGLSERNKRLAADADELSARETDEQQKAEQKLSTIRQETAALRDLANAELHGRPKSSFDRQRAEVMAQMASRDLTPEQGQAKLDHINAEEQLQQIQEAKQLSGAAQLENLKKQLTALDTYQKLAGDTVGIEAARKTLNDDIRSLLDQQVLSVGKARDGVHVFFEEMAHNSTSAAQQMHDVLGSAFNSLNDDLIRMIEGQKVSWAGFFRSLAGQVGKIGLERIEKSIAGSLLSGAASGGPAASGGANGAGSLLKTGEGLLGKLFGLGGSFGPKTDNGSSDSGPSGTEMDPIYTVFAASAPDGMGSDGLASLFGGNDNSDGNGGGGLLQSIFGGFLGFGGFKADGGDIGIGNAYVVGERGPELFVPRSPGRVIPNGQFGGNAYYTIDARGTNPADTELRVRRALREVHGSAVANGVAAQKEVSRRLPKGRT